MALVPQTHYGNILLTEQGDIAGQCCCGDNEKWLKCADGGDGAILGKDEVDVDYLYICVGGEWTKCYNDAPTGDPLTDPSPSVLKPRIPDPTDCSDLDGFPVLSVVVGNFDFDDGESFSTAAWDSGDTKLLYVSSSRDRANTITWSAGSYTNQSMGVPIKFMIGGTLYQFGTPDFSSIYGQIGYNSVNTTRRYFITYGYRLLPENDGFSESDNVTQIHIPIANTAIGGTLFSTYSGDFSVRIYKEIVTTGTDLSTLTPIQTGTLSLSPSDRGTWKAVSLTSAALSSYTTLSDPAGESCS